MSCQEAANFVCFKQGCLEIPKDCPRILYNVLLSCWKYNVESRPNFDTLCSIFEQLSADKSLLEGNSTDLSKLLISPTLHVEEKYHSPSNLSISPTLDVEETDHSPLTEAINEVEQHGNHTRNADKIEEGITHPKSMSN